MAAIRTSYLNQEELAEDVERAKSRLGPEVVRVRYSVGPNHYDEPSIYFRIVLTDLASREETLAKVAQKIEEILVDEIDPYDKWHIGFNTSFRSQSEQAQR